MPVKLFRGELEGVEKEINSWEKKKKCQVTHVALMLDVPDQGDMFEDSDPYYAAMVTWVDTTSVVKVDKPVQKTGSGEYPGEVPSCPNCTSPMVIRRRRDNQQAFFGCPGYPKCRGVINLTPEQEALLDSNPGYGKPSAPSGGTRHDPSSPNEADMEMEEDYTGGSPFDDKDQIPF